MKIFIAESHQALQDRLVNLISGIRGMEVVGKASSGREAVQRIGETNPDVVLLNIHISSGAEIFILEKIRKATPRSKLIALTLDSTTELRQRCIEEGADFVFQTSTESRAIFKALKKLLARNHPSRFTSHLKQAILPFESPSSPLS